MSSPDPAEALLASQADLLGEEVLGRGEPSFEACAALLPELSGYTFLGTGEGPEVFGVEPDGTIGLLGEDWGPKPLARVLFDPLEHLPPHRPVARSLGLVEGSLPAIHYAYADPETGLAWEEMAFACADGVFVRLHLDRPGDAAQRLCFRVSGDAVEPVSVAEFSQGLASFERTWEGIFSQAMEVDLPERRVAEACRASLARAFITFEGAHPHYGVGHYREARHDGFPPTTISMVGACIEWGLAERARRYLDYYFSRFVRPDGTLDYYGPAVSEYGQILNAVADLCIHTDQAVCKWQGLPKALAMADRLLALRRESIAAFPEGDVRRGLLFGSPEADTRDETGYYYSGSLWAWRGLVALARLLLASGDEPLGRRGAELLEECRAFRADIESSLAKSVIPGEPPFVPPVAGFDKPFPSMTADRFASYTNYRYWPEMLSAGFLRPEWADAIIEYRRTHGGEVLGTTRFEDRLDDWPYAGYGYGLLLRDRVQHYLLGFYGHLAGHCTRGTYTAYEQVALRGTPTRGYLADYCVPAQLVAPLMAKWMLVFEEADADILWLCRATPRRWLEPGGRIAVRRAPTRWGLVSFAIEAGEGGAVAASIELPCVDFPAEVRLRLRTPGGRCLGAVAVNGRPHADVSAEGDFIRIARPRAERIEVAAALRQSSE